MFLRNVVYHLHDYTVTQLTRSQINNTERRQNARGEYFSPKFVKKLIVPVLLFQTQFAQYSRVKIHASYN
jgi:hypothetical protein